MTAAETVAPTVGLPDSVTVRANHRGTFTVTVHAPYYVGETTDGGYGVIHGTVRQGAAPTLRQAWQLADRWAGETGGRLSGAVFTDCFGWDHRRIDGATRVAAFL